MANFMSATVVVCLCRCWLHLWASWNRVSRRASAPCWSAKVAVHLNRMWMSPAPSFSSGYLRTIGPHQGHSKERKRKPWNTGAGGGAHALHSLANKLGKPTLAELQLPDLDLGPEAERIRAGSNETRQGPDRCRARVFLWHSWSRSLPLAWPQDLTTGLATRTWLAASAPLGLGEARGGSGKAVACFGSRGRRVRSFGCWGRAGCKASNGFGLCGGRPEHQTVGQPLSIHFWTAGPDHGVEGQAPAHWPLLPWVLAHAPAPTCSSISSLGVPRCRGQRAVTKLPSIWGH